MSEKQEKRIRRHKKIRINMHGTKDKPRLFVFRSNQHIYAQLIDDGPGGSPAKVLISVSDKDVKGKSTLKKVEAAKEVGMLIAKKAVESKITEAIFDRGGIVYHGRVKAVADGAREGGLKF